MLEDFEAAYLELKSQYLTDLQISEKLFLSLPTLRRYKKKLGIQGRIYRSNESGITETQLQQAEAKGIHRKLILMRVRDRGWSIEQATTTPSLPRAERRTFKVNVE